MADDPVDLDRGKAVLVAGTDTGVGKTLVSLLLLAAMRDRGLRVAAMKPVETGCDPDPADALMLEAVAGTGEPLDAICPYRFGPPVAPASAAAASGETIDPERIRKILSRLRVRRDLVLVESAGGIGSPCGPGLLVLDLAQILDLPVLLVARHVLGTVGQTLVALRLMKHEGVRCAGVVLAQTRSDPPGVEGSTHVPLIEAHAPDVPVLGLLPFLAGAPSPCTGAADVRSWTRRHAASLSSALDLERLDIVV